MRRFFSAGLRVADELQMVCDRFSFSSEVAMIRRPVQIPWLWLLLMLCLSVAQLRAQTNVPAPLAGAIVTEWSGSVEIQLPGKPFAKPQRGQILSAGAVIATGDGRVLLTVRSDESKILVRPRTRLILNEPSLSNWNALEVLLGRIRAYIQKRTGGAPPFQLGTPSAVVAVRGTRFDVEVNRRGTTEVDVFDGLVEVASPGTKGQSVLISPGFSTRVAIGGAPEPPVPTREIRPDVQAPDAELQHEVDRERSSQAERSAESEQAEPAGAELNEPQDESREPREGNKPH